MAVVSDALLLVSDNLIGPKVQVTFFCILYHLGSFKVDLATLFVSDLMDDIGF